MLTLLQKHGVALADLIRERREAKDVWWQLRLECKISDMKQAICRLVGRDNGTETDQRV